jgi:hypothetical protein
MWDWRMDPYGTLILLLLKPLSTDRKNLCGRLQVPDIGPWSLDLNCVGESAPHRSNGRLRLDTNARIMRV